MKNRELGRLGEYLAKLYLEQKGYVFIRANYARPTGEIDLILRENDEIVFVEVKTRRVSSTEIFGRGSERIDEKKRACIRKTARIFLREERILTRNLTPRFDSVEIYLGEDETRPWVLHTPFAFGK